jgi:excisionase family DNA binding protein
VPTALPQLLTVKQAAQTLAVSQKLIRRLLRDGQLQGVRVGGAVRVTESGLHDYVERNRTGPAAAVRTVQPTPRRRRHPSPGFVFLDPSRW